VTYNFKGPTKCSHPIRAMMCSYGTLRMHLSIDTRYASTFVSVCCSVLQCVAVCCSVLQCDHITWYDLFVRDTAHCNVLQCVAVCRNDSKKVSTFVSACCSVLQCSAVCCSVIKSCGMIRSFVTLRIAMCCSVLKYVRERVLQCVAVCCSVLQCVAVCCNVLQGRTHRKCIRS